MFPAVTSDSSSSLYSGLIAQLHASRARWSRARCSRRRDHQPHSGASEELEVRTLPAITIAIDYSRDTQGFFNQQARRDELQRAADSLASALQDDLSAISPGGGNNWTATFTHPGNGGTASVSNLSVPADTLILFAGGMQLSGSIAEGGPGGFNASGNASWLNLLSTRGEAGAGGSAASQSDVGFWGGTIMFSTSASWHTGSGVPAGGSHDLYSIALHELSHFLGVGTSNAWFNRISGGSFTGVNSVAEFGGNVPLSGTGHWASGTSSTVPGTGANQTAVMVPAVVSGVQKEMTVLDWAALQDIGWQVELANAVPTLNNIVDLSLEEGAGEQTVNLSGITAGAGESQPLRVTASSSNSALIAAVQVQYVSPQTTGQVRFTPTAGQTGFSTITVVVEDGGRDGNLSTAGDNATTSRAFVVSVGSSRPTIISPLVSTDEQRPRIEWTAVPGAASYEVWIGNSSIGQNPWVLGDSATTFFDVPVNLGIGKMDLWVRGVRSNGTFMPWTDMHRFVVTTIPTMDALNVRQEIARPTVTWQAIPGAESYDVWVNNTSTGETQVIRQTVGSNSWTPAADLPMSRYRIWVRGIAADRFFGGWGVRSDFYVAPAPLIDSPAVPTFDRTPQFSWGEVAGADSYGIYLKRLADGSVIANLNGLATPEWTPSVDLADGNYAWWALAESSVANFRSGWSTRIEFHVGGQTSVYGPSSPSASRTPYIDWVPVIGAARYELWVNGDAEGPKVIHETNLTNFWFKVQTPLQSGGTYRVWVRAISGGGEVAIWSSQYVFTVSAVDDPEVPEDLLDLLANPGSADDAVRNPSDDHSAVSLAAAAVNDQEDVNPSSAADQDQPVVEFHADHAVFDELQLAAWFAAAGELPDV